MNTTISASAPIKSFTGLHAWQKGHSLVLGVYAITKEFPQDEKFALANQLRRAAVSLTSNIAEGFSHNSYREKVQFYSTALGSLTEIQNQLLIAKDIGYITPNAFKELSDKTILTNKLLAGLLKSSKTKIQNS